MKKWFNENKNSLFDRLLCAILGGVIGGVIVSFVELALKLMRQ